MTLFNTTQIPFVTYVLTLVPKEMQLTHYYSNNPFSIFIKTEATKAADIINAVFDLCSQEQVSHSSRNEVTIRQQLANKKYVPKIGGLTTTNLDTLVELPTGVERRTERIRTYAEFSLTAFVWFTSAIISTAPNRDELMRLVYPNQAIPCILTEILQKVRFTQVPALVIRIASNFSTFFVPDKFVDTYFDPRFLTQESNFVEYLALLNTISSSDGNYIAFQTVTETNRSTVFPQLNGGHQATFCLINTLCDYVHRPFKFTFELRPNSAFPATISPIQGMDACVLGSALYSEAELLNRIEFIPEIDNYSLSFMSEVNVYHYIINRVTTPSKPVPNPTKSNTPRPEREKPAPAVKPLPNDDLFALSPDELALSKSFLTNGKDKSNQRGSSSPPPGNSSSGSPSDKKGSKRKKSKINKDFQE